MIKELEFLGKNIKYLLHNQNKTQKELSDIIKITESTFSRNINSGNFKLKDLISIAENLNVKLKSLMFDNLSVYKNSNIESYSISEAKPEYITVNEIEIRLKKLVVI